MTELAEHIGKTMRSLRLSRGWSLQQVADLSEMSKAHIWELEQGISKNPTIKSVISLAKSFGVPVSYFLGETDKSMVPGHLAHAISAVNAIWEQAYQTGVLAAKLDEKYNG